MNNKRAELIEYIRVLYARQSDRDTKAGITYWAVMAGIIYLVFQLIGIISQVSATEQIKVNFYYAFSQIHLLILSGFIALSSDVKKHRKGIFDYRVERGESVSIQLIIIVFANIGLPLYCANISQNIDINDSLGEIHRQINYWTLLVLLILILLGSAINSIKQKELNMSPPATVVSFNSAWFKVFILFANIFFCGVFFVNIYYAIRDIYGNNLNGKIYSAALDASLILLGITILAIKSHSRKYLNRLSTLERDIIIHEISEKEITERLQQELLGSYVGDWIETLLKQVQCQADILIELSEDVESLLNDINKIDEKYIHERKGRAKEYIEKLKSSMELYKKSLNPLIPWLKEAELQASINKDEFIQSLVSSSRNEIESIFSSVAQKVNKAIERLEDLVK